MKKILLCSVLAIASTVAFSQTKLIAHRSHSGSNRTFSINESGNFGLPSHKRDTITVKQDSVKRMKNQKLKEKPYVVKPKKDKNRLYARK